MGHAGHIQIGDLAARVEIDHLALAAIARSAHQVAVGLVEIEVIEMVFEWDAAVGIVEQPEILGCVHTCSFSSTKYSRILGVLNTG